MKRIFLNSVLVLIKIYQVLFSPFLGAGCRYYPTCSSYAGEALEKYGIRKGLVLSFKRIMRCHPFSQGGYDPVP